MHVNLLPSLTCRARPTASRAGRAPSPTLPARAPASSASVSMVSVDQPMPLNVHCCFPSLAGRYSEDGATECSACDPGRYQLAPRQSSCNDCPAGSIYSFLSIGVPSNSHLLPVLSVGLYSKDAGATECEACPAGRAQAQPGSTSCQLCPVKSGIHAPRLCTAGLFPV